MNIVLVAEESAGLQMLRSLVRSCHRLVAVMAAPPNFNGTGSVWSAARSMGVETWPAKLVKEPALAQRLRSRNVDMLVNVHSLYIIHKEVLVAPSFGCFNLHPSALPRYAGLNAISWAIYRGEKTHGVTIHKMEPEIDTGPIVYQSIFPIREDDSALALSFKCIQQGVELMLKLLETADVDPQAIPLLPQEVSKREYFGKEVPNGGKLSWAAPAEKIIDFVRACDYFPFRSPWGHPRTRLGDQTLEIVKAERTGIRSTAPPGTIGLPMNSAVLVSAIDEWISVKKLKTETEYLDAINFLKSGGRFDN